MQNLICFIMVFIIFENFEHLSFVGVETLTIKKNLKKFFGCVEIVFLYKRTLDSLI